MTSSVRTVSAPPAPPHPTGSNRGRLVPSAPTSRDCGRSRSPWCCCSTCGRTGSVAASSASTSSSSSPASSSPRTCTPGRPAPRRDLAAFWSRRIRRLLPASLLVLAATAVATRLVAPETQWATTAHEVIAAAMYVENWQLARSSVDYLAAENAASPVQHFWSLSVEEQFYLVWPVLMLLLVALSRRRGWRTGAVVSAGLGVVVAASLAFSVTATVAEPASAYFITPTRIWELGVGALLAIAAAGAGPRLSATPGWLRALLAWAGLGAILVAALRYTGATPFPGWQAALPVLGAAAVIGARAGETGASPVRLLALRPVQLLGDISYSVYLWHWPMVVLVPYVSGSHLGRLDKAAIILVTAVLAWLSKTYVEDRFRFAVQGVPVRRSFQLAAAGMAVRRRPRGRPDGRGRPTRGHRPGHPRQGALRWRSRASARRRWPAAPTARPPPAVRRCRHPRRPRTTRPRPTTATASSRPRSPGSGGASSVTRRARCRSRWSATPTPVTGCRRSSAWPRTRAGRSRPSSPRSARRTARRWPGTPRASSAAASAGPARCSTRPPPGSSTSS